MARTQVQAELIATNAISGTIIADNAITATHIATNSISGTLVQDGGIVTTMIAANNVTAAKIVSDGVETRHLHSNVISGQSAVTAASGDYVLIGDTSDSNNLKKALVSDFGVSGISSSADATAITIDSSERVLIGASGGISYAHGDADDVVIYQSDGNVGMTIASATDHSGNIWFSDGTSGAAQYAGWVIYNHSDNRLSFGSNGSEGMRIDSSGRILLQHSTSIANASLDDLEVGSGSGNTGMTIYSGTSGYGGIAFADGNTGSSDQYPGLIEYYHNDNSMRFYTAASERMRIDSSGKVGIGTTSPDYPVEIEAGNISTGLPQFTVKGKDNDLTGIGLVAYGSNASHRNWGIAANQSVAGALNIGYTANATNAPSTGNITSALLIDSSGKVGIGTTSPQQKLHIFQTEGGVGDKHATIRLGGYGTTGAEIAAYRYDGNSNNQGLTFSSYDATSGIVERMRIDSTGDIRFGHTGAYIATDEVYTFYNQQKGRTVSIATAGNASHYGIDMWNQVGGSCNQILFRGGGSGATTGTITSTGNNATQYNTSSDYRLKENVDYTWDATTRLKQLKPVRFNWISDDTNTLEDGFLAHEVSSIVPNAVTGEKDAVYTEEEASSEMHIDAGDIKRQQLDHSKLVPLLVKTVQELEARIKVLEG